MRRCFHILCDKNKDTSTEIRLHKAQSVDPLKSETKGGKLLEHNNSSTVLCVAILFVISLVQNAIDGKHWALPLVMVIMNTIIIMNKGKTVLSLTYV